MSDLLLEIYKRIIKSAKRGQGTRLTASECHAMSRDDAIQQVIFADEESRMDTQDSAIRKSEGDE